MRSRARRVAALYREGEVGKATAAVMAKDPPRRDRSALRELRALFPRAGAEAGDKRGAGAAGFVEAPAALPGSPERSRVEVDESSATFERLAGGIAKYLSSAPNRAAPGPLGSRFEHWKVLRDSPAGLEATSTHPPTS